MATPCEHLFNKKLPGAAAAAAAELMSPVAAAWPTVTGTFRHYRCPHNTDTSCSAGCVTTHFLSAFATKTCSNPLITFTTSVCPSAWDSLRTAEYILMKTDTAEFYENLLKYSGFGWNRTKVTNVSRKETHGFVRLGVI